MDDIVDQSVLENALQRISELERIGQHQLHTDPPREEAANQTNATNAVEELYQRFPSLRRQSSSQELVASTSTSRRSLSFTRRTSSSTTFTTPPTSAMTRSTRRSLRQEIQIQDKTGQQVWIQTAVRRRRSPYSGIWFWCPTLVKQLYRHTREESC